jgi:hypothetical protein
MWSNPCTGPITSPFGPRTPPAGGASSMHLGTDIGAPAGAPVYAAAAGTVTFSQFTPSGGNEVWIQHTEGILTKYLHHSTVLVSRGQVVAQGQQIGTVGKTGTATGNHLHFETHVNGTPQDPQPFMAARGITLGTGAPITAQPLEGRKMIYRAGGRYASLVHGIYAHNGSWVELASAEERTNLMRAGVPEVWILEGSLYNLIHS